MLQRKYFLLAGLALLATVQSVSPSSWASDMKVKFIGPKGEDMSNPVMGDDHIVAVMSYERPETTQLCGGPMGRNSMKITVHADGAYDGVETSSRLYCPGSGLVRKAQYSKHDGKLSMTDLARLWDRLGEETAQERDLAAAPTVDVPQDYQTKIQRSADLRGVLSEKELVETVQTGPAALKSARFMQAFIVDGKIN